MVNKKDNDSAFLGLKIRWSKKFLNAWLLTLVSATANVTLGDVTQRAQVLENVGKLGHKAQNSFQPAQIRPVFSLSRGGGHGVGREQPHCSVSSALRSSLFWTAWSTNIALITFTTTTEREREGENCHSSRENTLCGMSVNFFSREALTFLNYSPHE